MRCCGECFSIDYDSEINALKSPGEIMSVPLNCSSISKSLSPVMM